MHTNATRTRATAGRRPFLSISNKPTAELATRRLPRAVASLPSARPDAAPDRDPAPPGCELSTTSQKAGHCAGRWGRLARDYGQLNPTLARRRLRGVSAGGDEAFDGGAHFVFVERLRGES